MAGASSGATFDVVIVGGGPAGANAALHLSRGGARVALVERESLPRYKTCGGGVVGRALAEIPPDVRASLPFERECRAVHMRFGDGRTFQVERDRPIVSMAMRADFDAAVLAAATRAGARVLAPCRALEVQRADDLVAVETSAGPLLARYLVVADGATGTTARLAGFDARLTTIPALEAEVLETRAAPRVPEPVATFDFEALGGGYGWTFPKSDHVSAGVLVMERGARDLRGALARYLAERGLADAERPAEVHGYVIPVRPRSGHLARGRVLLCGDAAGSVDPITGEGISLALRSGRLAAESILAGGAATAVERRYARVARSEIVADLRVARVLAHVLYRRPRLARALFDHAGQALCESVADVVLGTTTYRALVARPRNWIALVPALWRAGSRRGREIRRRTRPRAS